MRWRWLNLPRVDVVIVTGGDNGFNHIFVQPEIKSYADLRGKTVVVDAPNTAFGLLLYKVLKDNGLNKGDYTVKAAGGTTQRLDAMLQGQGQCAAAVINPPFSFAPPRPASRTWARPPRRSAPISPTARSCCAPGPRRNSDTLVRYIQAYVEGRRWALDPANKAEAIALLAERLKLAPDIAAQTYAVATDPVDGIAKDAKFDMEGFKNVLKLRAEIEGQWGGTPPVERYFDGT